VVWLRGASVVWEGFGMNGWVLCCWGVGLENLEGIEKD
jgi:hypothetical protein